MSGSVDLTEQLVTEIVVRDVKRSVRFYRLLGFVLLRDGGDFVELTWENHRLFLAQPSAFHEVDRVESSEVSRFPRANVRVMVPNVDDYWTRANKIGHRLSFQLTTGITVSEIS
jgi:catechol 2,3-dioxygenase-like lactoylglutathione lyase family enzyme